MGASLYASVRAGLVGLFLALLIYILWKISLRLYGNIVHERHADLVISAFAILLWVAWFGITQIILIAYDELYGSNTRTAIEQSESVPQLR